MIRDDLSLVCRVRPAKEGLEKPPLLVLMHGVGSNEADLFSLAQYIPDAYLVLSLRGPIELGVNRYAWYQVNFINGKPQVNFAQEADSRHQLLDFLDELPQYYSFDTAQVYVGGFSQGAIMAYSLGLLYPDRVKGMLVFSGRLLQEVLPTEEDAKPDWSNLRCFISHGTEDPVLPVAYAQQSLAFLTEHLVDTEYKVYTAGHTIIPAMIQDAVQWLNQSD